MFYIDETTPMGNSKDISIGLKNGDQQTFITAKRAIEYQKNDAHGYVCTTQ